MIHYPCRQGSEKWHQLRHGRPNASEYESVITAKKWEPTSGIARRRYALKLVTERILDISLDNYVTPAMIHGHDWEPKARAAYELQYGVDTEPVGYCTNDDGTAGASPDAFVGAEGSLEIKCPEQPYNHVGYVLTPDTLKDEYWVQVQGQLYITGRKWTDLVSYFQNMKMVVVRITPHLEFQAKLDFALRLFVQDLNNMEDLAKARGLVFPDPEVGEGVVLDGLTEEDVETYIASLQQRREQQSTTQERR